METVPKSVVDVLNVMLKDKSTLTWHVHATKDKIVMNIMWSDIQGECNHVDIVKRSQSNRVS